MPHLIKTQAEYERALIAVERLIDAEPKAGEPQAEDLEPLSLLIEAYEKTVFPIPDPAPIEAIRFRMDQMGLRQRDLVPYLGSRARVSEVLSGKRPLTLKMIRALHDGLGIPADVLIQDGLDPARPRGAFEQRF
ncbi:MAG TPA: DNA-binding protein [Thermoleophilia bacterium]|nr:DNA-binding protein [Thermoleophilia bacterium]